VKIGQSKLSKLSEGKSQRSGLFVRPTYSHSTMAPRVNDFCRNPHDNKRQGIIPQFMPFGYDS
ncbi:MAG: hypothetical protein WBN53_17855, partial [Thermodesulfobacteriota bacterium]